MKQEKKLAKAMITLFIDEEQNKLYDKYKSIKLSHKRKYMLLKQIYNKIKFIKEIYANESLKLELEEMQKKIYSELGNVSRKNWGVKNV